MKQLYTRQNHPLTLTSELGKGGEARIFLVAATGTSNQLNQVAKIYHQPTPTHEAKVTAMVAAPPKQPPTHTAIAWPTELLYHQQQFVGFLMPLVDGFTPLFSVYNPTMRRQTYPNFHWLALHRTAQNLSVAVQAIHATGHVVGDINESNILVNEQALVTLVDTDSFQIKSPNGQVYRCHVGKPEYTAPELQGVSFKTVDQTIEHDLFGLGVLIFQLLMEGFHPFSGVLPSTMSVGRVDLYCIKQGLFPYHPQSQVTPPPLAPPFEILHPDIQTAFQRCFVEGHTQPQRRPTAREWRQMLHEAEKALKPCDKNQAHLYGNHLDHCPWCRLEEARKRQPKRKPRRPSRQPQPVRQSISGQQSSSGSAIPIGRLSPVGQSPPTRQLTPWEMNIQDGWLWLQWLGAGVVGWFFFEFVGLLVQSFAVIITIFSVVYLDFFAMVVYLGLLYWAVSEAYRRQDNSLWAFVGLCVMGGLGFLAASVWQVTGNQLATNSFVAMVGGGLLSLGEWQVVRQKLAHSDWGIIVMLGVWFLIGLMVPAVVLPLVGPIVTSFIIGGVVGLGQWYVVRRQVPHSSLWIPASIVSWAASAVVCGLMGEAYPAAVTGLAFTDTAVEPFNAAPWETLLMSGLAYSLISGTALIIGLRASR